MNAVEHSGADATSKVELSASIAGNRLRLEVGDRGAWREPVPGGDRGHGLGLMRSLMDEVEIKRDTDGTTVRLERDVSFGPAETYEHRAAAVTFGEVRGVTVAIVEGEVDLAVAERVAAELDAASGTNASALVVDLSGVSYLDSSGVHMLFKLAHRRHATGGTTRIAVPAGPVRRVLELTGVEATLALDPSVDDAVARL